MRALPDRPTDAIKLADWLELEALSSTDESSSSGDLERALKTSGIMGVDADEAIERKTSEVFLELNSRAIAAGDGYPYRIGQSVVEVLANRKRFLPYIFCLCISYTI